MNEHIDSRFKWTFIIRFFIGMVIISILSSALFFLIITGETANFYVSLIYSFHQAELDILPVVIAVGLFEITMASLFTILFVLFLSHKVGGPIFKLERNIEKLRKGDLNLREISFRAADQGQILAAKFNEMLRNWHIHLTELKYNYCKFSARMNSLERKWPYGEESFLENSRTIARIKHDVEKMQDVLDRFAI